MFIRSNDNLMNFSVEEHTEEYKYRKDFPALTACAEETRVKRKNVSKYLYFIQNIDVHPVSIRGFLALGESAAFIRLLMRIAVFLMFYSLDTF